MRIPLTFVLIRKPVARIKRSEMAVGLDEGGVSPGCAALRGATFAIQHSQATPTIENCRRAQSAAVVWNFLMTWFNRPVYPNLQ